MKRLYLLLACGLVTWGVYAQNLTKAEYFVDIDPGVGAGVNVPFTAATSFTDLQVSVPVAALSNGLHPIFFRVKDANNVWSTTERTYFYKAVIPTIIETPTPAAVNVTKAEYFIDTDPGAGLGTNIPITSGLTVTDVAIPVSVSSLTEGLHQLLVRVRNANGVWSTTERTYFYKKSIPTITETPTPAAVNVTKAEYFIDTDPGIGLATNIPITSGLTVSDVVVQVPVTSLSEGLHQLLVRVRNSNGVWSTTERTYFYKLTIPTITETPTPAAVNLTKAEYFIDTDPGMGLATNIPITSGLTVSEVVVQVPVTSLSEGLHQLLVRVRNANGVWSTTERTYFYKKTIPTITETPTPAATNITQAEYFFDTDPGIGAGKPISITQGTTITDLLVPVSVSSLAEGTHKVFVRSKNANGTWSVTESASFSVCNGNVPTPAAASAITSTGFTANWATTAGAISYQLDVSADDFVTFVSGYNAKVINAPVTNAAVTGLSQGTVYKYRVRGVGTCASVNAAVISVVVPVATPTAQPSALIFPARGSNDLSGQFTPPATLPSGYLVVRRAGDYTTFVPTVNTNYTVGQDLGNGNGVVVHSAATPLFSDTGLSPNTNYFYTVFAYNSLNGYRSYNTAAPLKNSAFTLSAEPTAQATNLTFVNVTSTAYTVQYTAATGNPTGYIVLRKEGSEPASIPVDGTPYTTTVSADAIAYQGSAVTFIETGLTENTTYYYAVYAYNGSGTSINYKTLSPLLGNVTTPLTPPATPTTLQFTATTSSISATFTAVGAPSGYLVVRKQGAVASTWPPELNTPYNTGSVSDGTIIYVGPNSSFTDTGLTASTPYTYSVFPFRQVGSLISYQTIALQGTKSTFTAEPTAQPTLLSFSNWSTTSARLTFQPANGSPSGYLVLRKEGSAPAPTTIPEDGKAYLSNDPLGDAIVVSASNATIIENSGLSPGTEYYFQVYSYNGSGLATNYLTTVAASNSGATITIPDKPIAEAADLVKQTEFTAKWTTAKGATKYELDLFSNNFTNVTKISDLTGNSKSIAGLTPGTTYQYRVRALNVSGMSVNSDVVSQITIPATPVFASATVIGQTSFNVNWAAVTGADEFLLEVSATSNFLSPTQVSPNPSGNATSATIGGLSAGLSYYYRIRSKNAGGNSPYSATATQLMIPATPVGVDATNTTSSGFKAKWQTATGASKYLLEVTLATNDFNPSLDNYKKIDVGNVLEWFVTGLAANTAYKYRVWAVNASGETPTASASISVSTLEVGNSGPISQPIPGLSSGGTVESYRMFSIPWELQNSNNNIESIFSSLGTQADDKWKLLRWNATGSNWDRYPNQLSKVERGRSYWFNSMTQSSIVVTGTPHADNSFAMVLQPGWNQIGSPYDKSLSWTDVLAINSTVPNISLVETNLYKFDPSPARYTATDNLKAWSGNFVFNKGNQITLNIPSTTKVATGGRLSSDFENDISLNNWIVPFSLTVDGMEWSNSSIGMHPDAQSGIDSFDGMTVPRFIQYLELNSPHPEFFEPNFSSDIVPTASSHNWHFMAETNLNREYATLTWNHQSLGSREAKLILYDPAHGALIDMKEVGHYQFKLAGGKHPLHFLFARDAESLNPDITSLVQVYPNPVSTVVTFPFLTSSHDFVKLEIWDLTGKKIKTVIDREFPAGLQKVQWDVTDDQGTRVASGLYIYRFIGTGNVVQTGKLIIR